MASTAPEPYPYFEPIEHARRAILAIDGQGLLLTWGSAAEKLFGYRPDEILGRPAALLVAAGMRLMDAPHDVVRLSLQAGDVFECTGRHKDGREFPLGITCAAATDCGRARLIWCVEDVTRRRQADKALTTVSQTAAAAESAKNEFLSNISHEIRTPLNGIIGMTELLMETDPSDEQKEFIELLLRSSRGLVSLVNTMLDFSRMKSGSLALGEVAFDLRALLCGIMEAYGPGARDAGIELLCHVDAALPAEVRGDPGRVRQLVTCLVDNAVKFTARGSVSLVCEAVADQPLSDGSAVLADMVRIAVRDTGIGIPSHRLEEIFESFTQADGSMTRRFGGMGLGLSIARELTRVMHGHIRAESREGQGSTFVVTLPMRVPCSFGRDQSDTITGIPL